MQALAHLTRAHAAKGFAAWAEATQMSVFYRCATAAPVLQHSSFHRFPRRLVCLQPS
jgi:hypothetical protein